MAVISVAEFDVTPEQNEKLHELSTSRQQSLRAELVDMMKRRSAESQAEAVAAGLPEGLTGEPADVQLGIALEFVLFGISSMPYRVAQRIVNVAKENIQRIAANAPADAGLGVEVGAIGIELVPTQDVMAAAKAAGCTCPKCIAARAKDAAEPRPTTNVVGKA